MLVNHKLPETGDVTGGYIRQSLEHLRACQERVTAFLLGRIGTDGMDDAERIGA